jgi:hypothetical protein
VIEWTDRVVGALTVAGQWRSFTAFPSILAIMVVKGAAQWLSSRYAMERFSMTSTFINASCGEVKVTNSAELRLS